MGRPRRWIAPVLFGAFIIAGYLAFGAALAFYLRGQP